MEHYLDLSDCKLTFDGCCQAEAGVWFAANEFNALCCVDEDGKTHYMGSIPDEDIFGRYLYADIQYFHGKLYLTPLGAEHIAVYCIETGEFQTIPLNKPSSFAPNPYVAWLKFIKSVIVGESLYMLPRSYPAIIEMDLITHQLTYHTQWLSYIQGKTVNRDALFWSDCVVKSNRLILPSAIANMVFSFDIITKKFSIIYSGNQPTCYSGISEIQDGILLSERNSGRLELLDLSQNRLMPYGKMPEGFKTDQIIGFLDFLQMGDSIFAIPLWANMLLRIVPTDGEILLIRNYDEDRGESKDIAVRRAWVYNGKLYCMNNFTGEIDVFQQNGVFEKSFAVTASENFAHNMGKNIVHNKMQMFAESNIFPLKGYLSYILKKVQSF
jgi:hypothetical protein